VGGTPQGHNLDGAIDFMRIARGTLADAAKPGDTVYVMAGKYDERVRVKAGGTEGKPVAFLAMPRRAATVCGFDLEASYVRVEGFEITADKPATATVTSEIKVAHVGCIQTFMNNGGMAQDLLFEFNTCFDWGQGAMVESAPYIGSVRNWTWCAGPSTLDSLSDRG
jgi:hypothetical protein